MLMLYTCLGCGKTYEQKLFTKLEGILISTFGEKDSSFVCAECCELVGIPKGVKGALSSVTYTKERFIREYLAIKPDNQKLINELHRIESAKESHKEAQRIRKEHQKNILAQKNMEEKMQKEYKKSTNELKKKGYQEKSEEEYTCSKCGAIWYNDATDAVRNTYNILNSNVNRIKDLSQCPKCGSRASTHKTVTFWVDKNGNVLQ